jgi:foldase protein PrsA
MLFICMSLFGITPLWGAPPQFGYQALKINGKFVSPEIFAEEQNRFFMRWRTNSVMLHKTDEERIDLLLEDIINRVVVDEYLIHFAKITVTPREVDDYINRYIKARYPTEDQLDEYMAGMNYNDEADLKKGVEMYIRRLKVFPKTAKEYGVTIPPAELDQQYQQHVADSRKAVIRHILIYDPDLKKAQRQAEDIYSQLKNGADFSKLATQYSYDAGTKSNGGLVPPFIKGRMETEYNDKVFGAKPGELIPPFQISTGYEIILVEKFIGFFHPKDEFAGMLLIEKFGKSDQLKKWLDQIKPNMKIEILDPAMKAFRLSAKGRYSQAGVLYEKAFKVYNNENHLTRASECYQSAKDWTRLIKLGQFGMNKFRGKVHYYLYTAEGMYRSGKLKQGLDLMKKAEKVAANNIYFIGLVSQTYSKLGLEADAERMQKKAGNIK